MLFNHQVDPVQRALQVLFSQVGGESLKVGGAMFVSSMGSEICAFVIYNPLALLELFYSPLFTQHISYILMLNNSNRVQKILLVFIQSN